MSFDKYRFEEYFGFIKNDVPIYTLEEVCPNAKGMIISGPFGSNISRKFFVESGVPVIRGNNLTLKMEKFIDDGFVYVTQEKADSLNTYAIHNDLIFTAAGTIGQVGLIESNCKYEKYIISNKQLRARLNCKIVNPLYAYYWFAGKKMQEYIIMQNTGSTVPLINLTILKNLPIPVPTIEIQDKIVDVISKIDSKIETNNQINRNLSEQCDAIYKERFVVNPDAAWTEGHLSDLITVKYGKDHKKLEDGEIPCYGSGGVMRYVEKPLYDQESVLIPRKGSLNNVIYVDTPFWSVDTMFFTMMKIQNVAKFVYHFVKEKDLAAMNAGSAVPSMTTDILNAMELRIPSPEVLAEFESIVQPLYRAMKDNEIENKKLAELRDRLLPKLMSGEFDVSDLEI